MNEPEIKNIIDAFSKVKVLIIGDVMLDQYFWGTTDRISPEAPVPIVLTNKKECRLGGAANVALNVMALGATPLLCSVIGDDEGGREFLQLLRKQKISTDYIITSKNRPTTVKTRIFGKNQQILRFDTESDMPVNAGETKQLIEQSISLLKHDIDVIIFQDYNKGVLHEKIIMELIEASNKYNIPTAIDPKKNNFLSYKDTTLFKPNLMELKTGLKIEFDEHDKKNLDKAIDILNNELNNKITFLTLASKGIYVSSGSKRELIPAHSRDVADVSGAGDTVISVAALGLATKTDIFLSAKLANIAAGLVCQDVGVVPIDKDLLTKEIRLIKHD